MIPLLYRIDPFCALARAGFLPSTALCHVHLVSEANAAVLRVLHVCRCYLGAGLILNGFGAWLTTGLLLDVSRLMNVLFGAFPFGSVSYWSAKHPSGVTETLTPLQHGLLALAVLWSEILLAMLIVWATGLAEGELRLFVEITA